MIKYYGFVPMCMGYSVKVQFPMDSILEVSGDELDAVVVLVNAIAKKFFPNSHVTDIELNPYRDETR